jgi:hypothetical protein
VRGGRREEGKRKEGKKERRNEGMKDGGKEHFQETAKNMQARTRRHSTGQRDSCPSLGYVSSECPENYPRCRVNPVVTHRHSRAVETLDRARRRRLSQTVTSHDTRDGERKTVARFQGHCTRRPAHPNDSHVDT